MSSRQPRILVVEDDPVVRSLLVDVLEGEGYEIVVKEDGKAALMVLQRQEFHLVLTDLRMPGLSGLELFRTAKAQGITPPFIVLTAFGTIEEAVAAIKEGVTDFLTKPLKDLAALRNLVRRTLLGAGVRQPDPAEGGSPLPPDNVLFAGRAMQEVRRLILEVAPTQATVLLTGESGTGKELAAQAIHRLSSRSGGPFIAVNCGAIPETLLESELFGHEKGAFTGATQTRQGKFELAAGGTLFLDEIGELPLPLQTRFLRVLQERRFERVGGERQLHADVRVVAATNRNLADEVRARRFREDLFYRLNVFPIALPPLAKRRDALPVLVDYLVQQAAHAMEKAVEGVEPDALQRLLSCPWPGNVRELRNVIERAVILCRGMITVDCLPELNQDSSADPDLTADSANLRDREREIILATLESCGHNRRLTAEKLGISRRTLQYRLKEYGLVE